VTQHTICCRNVARLHCTSGQVKSACSSQVRMKLRTAQWRCVGTCRTFRAEIHQSEELTGANSVRSLGNPSLSLGRSVRSSRWSNGFFLKNSYTEFREYSVGGLLAETRLQTERHTLSSGKAFFFYFVKNI